MHLQVGDIVGSKYNNLHLWRVLNLGKTRIEVEIAESAIYEDGSYEENLGLKGSMRNSENVVGYRPVANDDFKRSLHALNDEWWILPPRTFEYGGPNGHGIRLTSPYEDIKEGHPAFKKFREDWNEAIGDAGFPGEWNGVLILVASNCLSGNGMDISENVTELFKKWKVRPIPARLITEDCFVYDANDERWMSEVCPTCLEPARSWDQDEAHLGFCSESCFNGEGKEEKVDKPSESTLAVENGTQRWTDKDGQYHRIDGPAVIYANGDYVWYHHGERHRVCGPAVVMSNGKTKQWWKFGKLHRVGGPAFIYADGSEEWHLYGKLHRVGGPARVLANGNEVWFLDGKLHRDGGPAITINDGTEFWYHHGKPHGKSVDKTIQAQEENVMNNEKYNFTVGDLVFDKAKNLVGRLTDETEPGLKPGQVLIRMPRGNTIKSHRKDHCGVQLADRETVKLVLEYFFEEFHFRNPHTVEVNEAKINQLEQRLESQKKAFIERSKKSSEYHDRAQKAEGKLIQEVNSNRKAMTSVNKVLEAERKQVSQTKKELHNLRNLVKDLKSSQVGIDNPEADRLRKRVAELEMANGTLQEEKHDAQLRLATTSRDLHWTEKSDRTNASTSFGRQSLMTTFVRWGCTAGVAIYGLQYLKYFLV